MATFCGSIITPHLRNPHPNITKIICLFEADVDLYVFNPDGTELGRATGTSRQEQVARRVTQTGNFRAVVRSYAGTGPYLLDISAGLGEPDQAPTIAIVEPAEGASVSGNVLVRVSASDNQGITKVEIAVDAGSYEEITSSFDGSVYRWMWESTTVANGAHTLTARVTDTAGQSASATRRVTVANEAPVPGAHEVTRTGRVSMSAPNQNLFFTVHAAGYVDVALGWGNTSDLDFYVYAPDGTYIGRAYTRNNPEQFRIDTVRWGVGAYRVRVTLYRGGDTGFTLVAKGYQRETFTGAVQPGAPDPVHTTRVSYSGRGRAELAWPGASDLDFYVYDPTGAQRARAYTLANPERVDFPYDRTGDWQVRVNLYGGAGVEYTLRLYVPEAVLS